MIYHLTRFRHRGDVLLCSAIVRSLVKRDPGCTIYFETEYPELFECHPNVKQSSSSINGQSANSHYSLHQRNAYELSTRHLIDAFAEGAGFSQGECGHTTEFYFPLGDLLWAGRVLPVKKYVVISPGPGQHLGRNWAPTRWQFIIDYLEYLGFVTVLVGTEKDYRLRCNVDYRGQTSYFRLGAVISQAKLFIGIDSFPAHVAGAVKTPRLVLFGITKPECVLCDSPNTTFICADSRNPFTGNFWPIVMGELCSCKVDTNPMNTISVQMVTHVLDNILHELP